MRTEIQLRKMRMTRQKINLRYKEMRAEILKTKTKTKTLAFLKVSCWVCKKCGKSIRSNSDIIV